MYLTFLSYLSFDFIDNWKYIIFRKKLKISFLLPINYENMGLGYYIFMFLSLNVYILFP